MAQLKGFVSKEDFENLLIDLSELKERVTKNEIDIAALKEILSNQKPSSGSGK